MMEKTKLSRVVAAIALTLFILAGANPFAYASNPLAYATNYYGSEPAPCGAYVTAAATMDAMSSPEILGLTGIEETDFGTFYTTPVQNWQTPKYTLYGTGINIAYNPYFAAEVALAGSGPAIDQCRSGDWADTTDDPDAALALYPSGTNDDSVWEVLPDIVIGTNGNDPTALTNYATSATSCGYTVYPVDFCNPTGAGLNASSPYLINNMYDIAAAADTAQAATGKALRYSGEGQQYATAEAIAEAYEAYVRGTQGYILSQLPQDAEGNPAITATFALVIAYDSYTGLYTIAPTGVADGSACEYRYVEACRYVANNYNTTAGGITADAATLFANSNLVMIGSQGLAYADQQTIYNSFTATQQASTYWVNAADGTCPGATYGVVMNSAENAQNYGRILGCLYPQYISQSDWVAYYLDRLEHLDTTNTAAFLNNVNLAMNNGGIATYVGVPWYNGSTIGYGWVVSTYNPITVADRLIVGIDYLKTSYPDQPWALIPSPHLDGGFAPYPNSHSLPVVRVQQAKTNPSATAIEGATATESDLVLPADMDIDALRQEIVDDLNRRTPEGRMMPARKATLDDVDFSKAFKFYNDTSWSIFDLQTNNFNEVRSALEQGSYIFEVPVYIGNDTFVFNISIGGSVSDEDRENPDLIGPGIAYLESVEGEWHISADYYFPDRHLDYYDIVCERAGIYDQRPLLVGGLPYFHSPVALFADEQGNIGKMAPIWGSRVVPWEALGLKPQQDDDVVLDYAAAKDAIAQLPGEVEYYSLREEEAAQASPSVATTTSTDTWPGGVIEGEDPRMLQDRLIAYAILGGCAVALCAVIAATVILVRRRRKRCHEPEHPSDAQTDRINDTESDGSEDGISPERLK
jgi:hypothetical protein